MLNLLAEHWGAEVQLIGYVALLVGLYYKLKGQLAITRSMVVRFQEENRERWETIEMEHEKLESLFMDHKESEAPHLNCPAHTEAITQMKSRLDRIQSDITGVRDELSELNRTLLMIATNAVRISNQNSEESKHK
jgi:hypothetical protein